MAVIFVHICLMDSKSFTSYIAISFSTEGVQRSAQAIT